MKMPSFNYKYILCFSILIFAFQTMIFNQELYSETYAFNYGKADYVKCVYKYDTSDTLTLKADSIWAIYSPEGEWFSINYWFSNALDRIYLKVGKDYTSSESFTGVGTWSVIPGRSMVYSPDGDARLKGDLIINDFDTTSGYASGSFALDTSAKNPNNNPFSHFSGVFTLGSAGMTASISPGTEFNVSAGDSIELDITVVLSDGNPAEGATLYVDDPFTEEADYESLGVLNESGMISYTVVIPTNQEPGNYSLNFYAELEDEGESNVIECTINIQKTLYLEVDPGPNIFMGFKDTTEFTLTITDDLNDPVEGAGIIIADNLQTDGTPVDAGATDAEGRFTYTVITNDETEKGKYNIKFSAFKEGFPDTVSSEVNIDVSAKLYMTVIPDTIIQAMPKDTLNYTVTITDFSDAAVEGVTVYLIDSLSSDGIVKSLGETDDIGSISNQIIIPDTAKEGHYILYYFAEKEGFENSDTLKRRIDLTVQKDCMEIGVFEFCTTAPKGWISADSTNPKNNKIKQEGVVTVNSFLNFKGTMTLDTVLLELAAIGEFYIDEMPLPGGGQGKYVLNKGTYALKLLDSNGIITDFINTGYEVIGEICGFKFKITQLELLGGRKADGCKIGCKIEIPGIAGGCNEPDSSNSVNTEIELVGLTITDTLGFEVDKLSIKNMGLFYPQLCLKDFLFSYNNKLNKMAIGAEIGMPFGSVGGGFALVNSLIDSIGWKIDGGWPPKFVLGTSTVGISGFFGHISNITKPELEMALGGIFIDLSSEYLYSIDVSGKYRMPSFFELGGTGSFFKPPVGISHWQMVGNISASYDFSNWMMELKGGVKIATTDGVKYLINGNGSFKMDNKLPQPRFSGKFTGNIDLPKFKDEYPWKWLNSMFSFPVKGEVWTRFIYGKSKLFYGNATFQSGNYGPYKLDFVLNLAKSWGDEDYFWFKAEKGKKNIILKDFDGDPSKSIALFDKYKGSKLLDGEIIQTIEVPENTELIVVNVQSDTQAPASTIEDPDGNLYTESSVDKTVVLSYTEDNLEAFWTLSNPISGDWIVTINDPAPTDSLDVFSHQKQNDFTINLTQNERQVIVSWDTTGMATTDSVYIFLDKDGEGLDGFYVAVENALYEEVSFMLDDSIDACHYYLYAMYEGDHYSSAYAEDEIMNTKASLFPPENIIVEYDTVSHIVYISWSPSDEEGILGYSIRLVDENGLDSLIADVYNSISEISFELEDIENKKVRFIAYNENGHSGCPSEDIDIEKIAVGIEEIIQADNTNFSIYPNPATSKINIKYKLNKSGNVQIKISDVMGRDIITMHEGIKKTGTYTNIINLEELSNGIYFCTLRAEDYTETIKMVVIQK